MTFLRITAARFLLSTVFMSTFLNPTKPITRKKYLEVITQRLCLRAPATLAPQNGDYSFVSGTTGTRRTSWVGHELLYGRERDDWDQENVVGRTWAAVWPSADDWDQEEVVGIAHELLYGNCSEIYWWKYKYNLKNLWSVKFSFDVITCKIQSILFTLTSNTLLLYYSKDP